MSDKIKNKLKIIPKGVMSSLAFFSSNVISMGISYLTTPLYTRMLSAGEYGQVAVFNTWMQMFGRIAMFALASEGFNNGMVEYPDRRDEYSFSMLVLSNLITICFCGMLLALFPMVKVWTGLDLPQMLLMTAVFLIQPGYNFWMVRQRYELRYKATFFWAVVLAVLPPIVAVLCVLHFQDSRMYARIFGMELPRIAVYIGFYIFICIKGRLKPHIEFWKPAFLFTLPLIPNHLSTDIMTSSDRLMISRLVSDSAAAYYSVAHSAASLVTTIWLAANISFIPFIYEKCKERDYASISKVALSILTLFAAGCTVIIMLAPEAIKIMATEEYREAIYVIPPLIGGVFFRVHYFLYANVLFYHRKPQYVTLATLITACINLFLNYIFMRRFGYFAAGYTTLACFLLQAAMDYFAMYKIVGQRVYDMKYIGALSFVVIIIALASNFLYRYNMIRYVIAAILLAGCVAEGKKVLFFRGPGTENITS